jgi:threonine dehydrogenase-like Zn-dependent dehydrogenase
MGTVFVLNAPRTPGYQTYEDAPLKPDEVRIKTLYSGISAGTELTFYRGTNPYLSKQWDADNRLFIEGEQATFSYPVLNLGYEEVGEVIELGAAVTDVTVGTRLFGTWGHRTHFAARACYALYRV